MRQIQVDEITEGPHKSKLGLYCAHSFIGPVEAYEIRKLTTGAHKGRTGVFAKDGTFIGLVAAESPNKIGKAMPVSDRLSVADLAKIANHKAGFLDSLPDALAARVAEHMTHTGNHDEASALREVTRDPAMATLWAENRNRHTLTFKE